MQVINKFLSTVHSPVAFFPRVGQSVGWFISHEKLMFILKNRYPHAVSASDWRWYPSKRNFHYKKISQSMISQLTLTCWFFSGKNPNDDIVKAQNWVSSRFSMPNLNSCYYPWSKDLSVYVSFLVLVNWAEEQDNSF